MSRFYVGQRVRIVRDIWGDTRHLIGKECVISDLARDEFPGMPIGLAEHPNFDFSPDELEPILYDGNQLVSWESMKDLWTPAGGVTA